MVSWAPSRRAKMERIETEAEALIRDLGDSAYHEARRREHEASSDAIAEEWALVARAVARQTGSRIGLNISTQLEMNTFFVMDREPGEGREARSFAEAGSFAEDGPGPQPDRNDIPTPQPYRIQFLGAGDGRRAIAVAGSRDPRLGCFRRDHRRRGRDLAAKDGRVADSRPRRRDGFLAREGRAPSDPLRLTRPIPDRPFLRPIGRQGELRGRGGFAFPDLVDFERFADPAQRQR